MARRRRSSGNSGTTLLLIIIGVLIYLLFPKIDAANNNGNSVNHAYSDSVANASLNNGMSDNDSISSDVHDAVIFVVGNTENSPAPKLTSNKNIASALENVFYSTPVGEKPNVIIFSAVANPVTIDIDSKYYLGQAANKLASASNFNDLLVGIEKAANTSPSMGGADYFAALMEAFEYSKNYNNPLVIVYGSGLSDTGVFNFSFDNLITDTGKEYEKVNSILSTDKRFSSDTYSNVTLYWYGVGQTVGEQPDLKEWKKSVQNTYSAIFEHFDVNHKFYLITVSSNDKSVKTEYDVLVTMLPVINEHIKISLNERYLSFYADSDVLINESEVRELLKGVAETLNKNESVKIKLTGYQTVCATNKTLSVERANTIKNILVDLGVDANRITTDGVAGPPDNRVEEPRCGYTGVAVEHRTVILETYN